MKKRIRVILASPVVAMFLFIVQPAHSLPVPISTCGAGLEPLCTEGTPTEGWDGAGLNSVTIDYYVGNTFQTNNGIATGPGGTSIGIAAFDAAITIAMNIWSSVVDITWNKIGDAVQDAANNMDTSFVADTIYIYAAAGDHFDGFPFDGAWNPDADTGNVLAHAFPPPDIDGFSGNVHLDNDEMWVTSGASIGTTSATIDLVSILLHELGHSLGLAHTNGNDGDVMQPLYFGPLTTLSTDDTAAIRSLYACAGDGCDGGPVDPPTQVPEPGTLMLFAMGLLLTGIVRRRRTS